MIALFIFPADSFKVKKIKRAEVRSRFLWQPGINFNEIFFCISVTVIAFPGGKGATGVLDVDRQGITLCLNVKISEKHRVTFSHYLSGGVLPFNDLNAADIPEIYQNILAIGLMARDMIFIYLD